MDALKKRVVNGRVSVICWVCLTLVQVASGASLKGRIDKIVQSRPKAAFSIHIIKAESGRTVYAHHAHQPRIPASNMKVVTSAAALHYLGRDFEYVTKVGLIRDTLIVFGSGDPLLGDQESDSSQGRMPGWIMSDMISKLNQAGKGRIKDIIIDSTVFDDERVHPSWPASELNRAYSPEVCGLNYNANCIRMTVRNTKGRIAIAIEPKTQFVQISNLVRPVQSGKSGVGAYRKMGTPNALEVRGRCLRQEGLEVAIEQPAVFFGYILAERLGASGIAVSGQLIERALGPDLRFQRITEYRTPLALCLQRCNKDSFNLAAEALLKTVGAHGASPRAPGSWIRGQKLVGRYLEKLGVAESEYRIDDGSGLSRENRLSAHALTTVLASIYRSRNWDFYSESLAIGGADGTLSESFLEDKHQGKIKGKTGYLSGIRAFSGVATTDNGDYIFSILANKAPSAKRIVYQMAKTIIDCN